MLMGSPDDDDGIEQDSDGLFFVGDLFFAKKWWGKEMDVCSGCFYSTLHLFLLYFATAGADEYLVAYGRIP